MEHQPPTWGVVLALAGPAAAAMSPNQHATSFSETLGSILHSGHAYACIACELLVRQYQRLKTLHNPNPWYDIPIQITQSLAIKFAPTCLPWASCGGAPSH
jgi:hypothetical protein